MQLSKKKTTIITLVTLLGLVILGWIIPRPDSGDFVLSLGGKIQGTFQTRYEAEQARSKRRRSAAYEVIEVEGDAVPNGPLIPHPPLKQWWDDHSYKLLIAGLITGSLVFFLFYIEPLADTRPPRGRRRSRLHPRSGRMVDDVDSVRVRKDREARRSTEAGPNPPHTGSD